MVLVLSSQQLSAISAHAERVYPEECCGLMVGEMRPQSEQAQSEQTQSNTSRQQQPVKQLIKQPVKQVVQLFPLINNWTPDEGTPDVETTEARTEAPTETSTEKSLT
ncbi:MAG: Mov34/MPN/PAD-1 family protein, partial [Phormidesmis sp.]